MIVEFLTSNEFFAYFIMSMSLAFMAAAMWVMYDLDKDDEKINKNKKNKFKKA